MSAVRNSLWGLVLLAAIATAVAGIRALTRTSPSLPSLGDLSPAIPSRFAGKVWVAQILEGDCDRCHELGKTGLDLHHKLAPEVSVETVALATPPAWSSEPGGGTITGDEAVDLSDRLYALAGPPQSDPAAGEIFLRRYGNLGDWSLTAEDGKPFGRKDLEGKIWVTDFIFTRCSSACPAMCVGMESIIAELPGDPRLRFVSFSVDPNYDKPAVLQDYKGKWKGDPRWRFVTGMWVYKLAYEGFKVEEARPNPQSTPGNEFFHSQRFTLVDGKGEMRGIYVYDYANPETLPGLKDKIVRDARALLETPDKVVDHAHDARRFLVDREGKLRGVYPAAETKALIRDARTLARTSDKLLSVRTLPRLNAMLNGVSFLFLSLGLGFILRKRIGLHKACMTTAFLTSMLFLASYLTYHFQVGSVKYAGEGWMRTAYFAVLISHTVLAVLVAPLAVITVRLAWHERFDRHRTIARWTLPIWMYVSLTGILVYTLLYGPA